MDVVVVRTATISCRTLLGQLPAATWGDGAQLDSVC